MFATVASARVPGSGTEGRRRGRGEHVKCAERQMEELTENKQTLCSH